MIGVVKFAGFLALVCAFAYVVTASERENNRHINAAIYPAFRAIEQACGAERFPHETVRCQGALALQRGCLKGQDGCAADDYYRELDRLGFDLPPFYQPGYTPK